MRTITSAELTPAIVALFDLARPTMPRAFNVLEGTAHGHILVDDRLAPTWALVRDAIYGTLYLAGEFTPSLLADLVEHFRQHGEVGIGCWPDEPLNAMLPANPDYDGTTLYFTNRSPTPIAVPPLPPPYQLALRDGALFNQSFDRDATLASFGTIDDVLRLTLGVVVLHNGIVVCEAATGAATHGLIEVGVTTAPEHRRKGLASIACARLVELCEAQGYATWWDCATQNSPSVRLARKLGYQVEREYRYLWWDKRTAQDNR
jgi:RimJ/RimL family protein N-acetyltransferase